MRTLVTLNHLHRLLVLSVVLMLVSGCGTGLSKNECELADWYAIGYEDGVQGRHEARAGKHRKACAGHGVAINFQTYRKGWDDGMRRYCQPGNGFRQGRAGSEYNGVCPVSLESDFLDAYDQGRELYSLEREVRQITRNLQSKRSRVQGIETEIRDTGIQLVAGETSTERRVVLLDELRRLAAERADIESEIPLLERELYAKKKRLAAISGMDRF